MKVTLVGAGKLGMQLYAKLICIEEIQFVEWYIRSSKKIKTKIFENPPSLLEV